MTTKTMYLNVEFIATIPVKIEVEDDLSPYHLERIATKQAWDEIYSIDSRDGLSNWLIPSGTIDPMTETDIADYEGLWPADDTERSEETV